MKHSRPSFATNRHPLGGPECSHDLPVDRHLIVRVVVERPDEDPVVRPYWLVEDIEGALAIAQRHLMDEAVGIGIAAFAVAAVNLDL